ARGVVFVDLSLAQIAALGLSVALLAGHTVQSDAGYWYSLAFALGGALLFAAARAYEGRIQQEAVIGIVYAVSASLGVLALDRAPQGSEHIKQLLIGSILTVSPREVATVALLYGAVGLVHFAFRRPLLEVSLDARAAHERGRRVLAWDLLFYATFAVVVTSSVRIAGVLLVFAYLIVPAALAGLFAQSMRARLLLAWALGALLTAGGLLASWSWDLPTGPAIVSAFGVAMAAVGVSSLLRRLTARRLFVAVSSLAAAAGVLLVAAPQADQPWLDAAEAVAPSLRSAFLSPFERSTHSETIESVGRAQAELERLRAREEDVRWERLKMDADKADQMRQYIAGRSEILAGDRQVLRELRARARARQRWWLGVPLLMGGLAGLAGLGLRRIGRRLSAAATGRPSPPATNRAL
ncbi:MAG: metal ABC transporter permease, partial [Burkholderiaceae bacterium]